MEVFTVNIEVTVSAEDKEQAVHKARCALGIYTSFRDHSVAEAVRCSVFDADGHYKATVDLDDDLIKFIA